MELTYLSEDSGTLKESEGRLSSHNRLGDDYMFF